jgi:TolA-binding protein
MTSLLLLYDATLQAERERFRSQRLQNRLRRKTAEIEELNEEINELRGQNTGLRDEARQGLTSVEALVQALLQNLHIDETTRPGPKQPHPRTHSGQHTKSCRIRHTKIFFSTENISFN